MSSKYELTKLSKVLIALVFLGGIGDYAYNHFFAHEHTEAFNVSFDNMPHDMLNSTAPSKP